MPDHRPDPKKIAFVASPASEAQEAWKRLTARYGQVPGDEAEVVVALGGDGLMLQTLHKYISTGKPIYGMNRGSVGFLMNEFNEDGLLERSGTPNARSIHPLRMRRLSTIHGQRDQDALAINEVSLLRQTSQVAKLRISIDGTRGWRSSSPTACWWQPRPARPPTTSRPTGRSCRSMPPCSP
jgi:NAD+ kinase